MVLNVLQATIFCAFESESFFEKCGKVENLQNVGNVLSVDNWFSPSCLNNLTVVPVIFWLSGHQKSARKGHRRCQCFYNIESICVCET